MADGSLLFDTKINNSGFKKGMSKLGGIAKTAIKGVAAAGGALAAVGGAAIKLASNLEEVQNVVDVTFGKNAKQINEWAKNAATSFGLSELQAKQFTGTLGAMLKSMGLTDSQVLKMSESMVGLAGDFASFYNLPTEEAFEKIRSGISGETEPLKQLGINMSVTNLEAYALAQGINKSYKEMTQAEQATLRYNYLMSVSADAQGDFERTSDSLANQLRILQLNVQDLGSSVGSALIPMAKEATKGLNDMIGQLKTAFSEGGFDGLAVTLGDVLSSILQQIAAYLPQLTEYGASIIISLIQGLLNNAPALAESAIQIVTTLINAFLEVAPMLLSLGGTIILNLVQGITENLPTITEKAISVIQSLMTGLIEFAPQLISAGAQMIVTLIQGLAEAAPNLTTKAIDLVIALAEGIISNLPLIIQAGLQLIAALAQGIINNLPKLIENVPRIINDFANSLYGQLPTIIMTGVKIILALIKGLIQSIPTLIANIPQIIMAIVNVFTLYNWAQLGKSAITKLGQGIKNMASNVKGIATNLAKGISEGITNILKGAASWGKNMVSNLGSAIRSGISFIAGAARSVASGAIKAIKNTFNIGTLKSIGSSLVKGIWNGISSVTGWILSKIRGFGSAVIKGIKGIFGIHSPSTIMRDEVGKNLVLGIGKGFEKSMPGLKRDMQKELGTLTDRMKATVDVEASSIGLSASGREHRTTTKIVNNNNDNGVTQNVTIVNPERTPSENARQLRKVGRDLVLGY